MAVSLELLTDDDILDYSNSDGLDRILYDHRDFNLKYTTRVYAMPGGVYDTNIFGSPFVDKCVCGKLRQPSPDPCPNCGVRVFSKEEALRRFARIDLPFFYLNQLRFEVFYEMFQDIFKDCKIKLNFVGDDLRRNGYSATKGTKKLGIKVFDTCQFEFNPKKNELSVSEFITDESKCSYEGLLAIIEKHFPDRAPNFRKLINRYYLVQPAIMRPFTIMRKNGKALSGSHKLSTWYSVIIRFCCVDAKKANDLNYEEVMSKLSTPGEKVRYTALLRAFLNAGKKEATELLNTSKDNFARNVISSRTKESARCPIVPAVDLAIDELGVPTHIAYEMCRAGFVKYLQNELNFSRKEALKSVKEEAMNPETQRLFKEYAEKQIVLG